MSTYAAVLFDLDDTLCVHDQGGEALLERTFERADVAPLFDLDALGAVDTTALPTAESRREFHRNFFRAAAEGVGADPSQSSVEAVTDAFLAEHDPAAVSFREGARDALAAARERHDVALVTNGGESIQRQKLATLGIEDAFDAEVYCDPGSGVDPKPDPTPLRMAVDELDVAPREAVKIGDDHAADVAGAHAVGMHSAWVPLTDPDPDPDPAPTHVFDGMAEVAGLFRPR